MRHDDPAGAAPTASAESMGSSLRYFCEECSIRYICVAGIAKVEYTLSGTATNCAAASSSEGRTGVPMTYGAPEGCCLLRGRLPVGIVPRARAAREAEGKGGMQLG